MFYYIEEGALGSCVFKEQEANIFLDKLDRDEWILLPLPSDIKHVQAPRESEKSYYDNLHALKKKD
jgi:hypothetical protein